MGIRERQDRERQAVTASILDAARDLFVNEGYRNVSIRKIAERIEYSPAAIYSYFPSKDDIFLALAEEGFDRLGARVLAAQVHDGPLENIRAGWYAFYEFSKEQPEYFELMFVDRSVPLITAHWERFEFLHQMLAEAAQGIQLAIDAGHFPATLNPWAAMHALWAALLGPAVIGIRHRATGLDDYDALARDVLDTVIGGFQAGVTPKFVPTVCIDTRHAAAPASAGDRSHES